MKIGKGQNMHMVSSGPRAGVALSKVIKKAFEPTKKPIKTTVSHQGYRGNKDHLCTIPAEIVIAIRALHQYGKWNKCQIAKRYKMSVGTVENIMRYLTRCNLEPTRYDYEIAIQGNDK